MLVYLSNSSFSLYCIKYSFILLFSSILVSVEIFVLAIYLEISIYYLTLSFPSYLFKYSTVFCL